MKRIPLFVGVLALLLSAVAIYLSCRSSELVYVDVNKLIDGYKRTKVEKAEFDKKVISLKANIDSLMSGWQNDLKIYEKERSSLSAKELELKQQLLSNKQQQINGYQEAIQKKIQEEDKKVTQTVLNDINDFVKQYGEENGYRIILGASGGGNIMYAHESTDLTENVLKGLNAEYDKK